MRASFALLMVLIITLWISLPTMAISGQLPGILDFGDTSTTNTTPLPSIPPATTKTTPPPPTPNYYTDIVNGFRIQVPEGWMAENLRETSVVDLNEEERRNALEVVGAGGEQVARLCPQSTAEPIIGGEFQCPITADPLIIGVKKYDFDLDNMQPFGDIIGSGGDIATHDLLAFELRNGPTRMLAGTTLDENVVSAVDRTTNLVDADTGEVIANNVQVKIVEYTYSSQFTRANNLPDNISLVMFVVYNDPESDEVEGYQVSVGLEGANVVNTPPGSIMTQIPTVKQIFDSFVLVRAS
jgi:hypothetical protein